MIVFETLFQQVAILLIVTAAVGFLGRALHQPLIIAFIAVGIIAGPNVLGIVEVEGAVQLLAQLGIALLLFIVGLKLDLRVIRTLGPVATATGLGQVFFTSVVGYLIALGLGFDPTAALYIGVALTFSSTIIIVKLLTDKGELEQLHGRIAIGFLIVQDIVVVIVMILLSAFGAADAEGSRDLAGELAAVAIRGAIFIAVIAAIVRWVLPRLLERLAHTPELLVLFGIAWAASLAAGGDLLGFSEEVGAFIAGVSLASTPFREALSTRLSTLRDFLLLFFFVELGALMDFADAGQQLPAAIALSAFVLIGNPIIVMLIMGAMRYRRRVSFLAGLTVAQISEFSLIFAALGVAVGHITTQTLGLITIVGVITIGLSTYMIMGSHRLYEWLAPYLGIFERRTARDHQVPDDRPCPKVIVYGVGRYGGHIIEELHAAGVPVMGVDFDPYALSRIEELGVPTLYGDAEDFDLPATLPLDCAEWIISSAPGLEVNRALLAAMRSHGVRARVALTAHTRATAELLAQTDADLVLRPFIDAGDEAVRALGYEPPVHGERASADSAAGRA
ncbi:MAG TPA: cation:proton antiporter family protein [Candidatus Limnocylindria bacterium]|nr:cation:proton antiporter family protein [Candidatus Limnocylindria bacterium]